MKNITYLFGAGASAQVLPVVRNMPKSIADVAKVIEDYSKILVEEEIDIQPIPKGKTNLQLLNQLLNQFKWMQEKASSHASIDTFAKKLSINNEHNQLRNLKVAMSVYFTIEQSRQRFDKRYDTFFASVLSNFGEMPQNLKILSWNYDSQFEMAYSEYNNRLKDIGDNALGLNIQTKHLLKRRTNGFSLLKLNGTSSYHPLRGYQNGQYANSLRELDNHFFSEVLINFGRMTYSTDMAPTLSFAWEGENNTNLEIVEMAQRETNQTNVLVVVGYSFPFFNREIDRAILNSMENLEKIYYQDMNAHQLKARLLSIKENMDGIEVIPYTEVDQFFLPYEL
ncbi:hypothetical protein [Flagellimonas lutimaris]|uniref:hypothetical protein n=1 Tax=Flagellimonas lutimaris TaxID=475082 RepID=UPI003F5CDC63